MKKQRTAGRPPLSASEVNAVRERIVASAKRLFFTRGFESVSIRNIADEVGCSPMAIYRYFENKHAILRQIWSAIFSEAHGCLIKATAGKRTPMTRMRTAFTAYALFWIEHPEYFHIVYLTVDSKSLALGAVVLADECSHVKSTYEFLEALLAACIENGDLDGAPTLMLQTYIASLYGLILCILTVPEFNWPAPAQFTRELLDRLIAGHKP